MIADDVQLARKAARTYQIVHVLRRFKTARTSHAYRKRFARI